MKKKILEIPRLTRQVILHQHLQWNVQYMSLQIHQLSINNWKKIEIIHFLQVSSFFFFSVYPGLDSTLMLLTTENLTLTH